MGRAKMARSQAADLRDFMPENTACVERHSGAGVGLPDRPQKTCQKPGVCHFLADKGRNRRRRIAVCGDRTDCADTHAGNDASAHSGLGDCTALPAMHLSTALLLRSRPFARDSALLTLKPCRDAIAHGSGELHPPATWCEPRNQVAELSLFGNKPEPSRAHVARWVRGHDLWQSTGFLRIFGRFRNANLPYAPRSLFNSHDGPDDAAIHPERRPVRGRGQRTAYIDNHRRHFFRGRKPLEQRGRPNRAKELLLDARLIAVL